MIYRMVEDLIILGSGCAGLTAAIYAARGQCKPLVIEGRLTDGQLTQTTEVENYPGFPEGVQGYELIDRMKRQAERFGARFANEEIKKLTIQTNGLKKLESESKEWFAKSVIIATGNSPRRLNIPGENELYGGKGVSACATCDGAFYRGEEVCVIGGGDTACEEALFLTRFCSKVFLLHRRDTLRASKIMADRVLGHSKIEVVWNVVPKAFIAGGDGFLQIVQLQDVKTGKVSDLKCKGAFLAVGHLPNTEPFKGVVVMDEQGYILTTSQNSVGTNIPGVFAAGDCVDKHYRQAVVAAGLGCQAALEAERWLSTL